MDGHHVIHLIFFINLVVVQSLENPIIKIQYTELIMSLQSCKDIGSSTSAFGQPTETQGKQDVLSLLPI